jgi:hypothetical protein
MYRIKKLQNSQVHKGCRAIGREGGGQYLDYIASACMMIDELERMRKEVVIPADAPDDI